MDKKQFVYALFRGLAVAATLISIILCTLLAANWLQLVLYTPLDTPGLKVLEERYRENPSDSGLLEEIRSLDLLARKAYFTKSRQIRTGGFILLGSIAVSLIAFAVMAQSRRSLPVPGKGEDSGVRTRERRFARILIGGVTLLLLIVSVGAVILSDNIIPIGVLSVSETVTQEALPEADNLPAGKMADVPAFPADYEHYWPAFRGPGGVARAEGENYPLDWDVETGRHILWSIGITEQGFNSPVVWKEQIFLAFGDTEQFEVVSFSTTDGSELWRTMVKQITDPETLPDISEDTGYAAPTLATDGEGVYGIFATGDVFALEMGGSIRWSRNLGSPSINYGHASSLMTYKNCVLVQYDHEDSARIMALDRNDGKSIWEKKRDVSSSWASPVFASCGEQWILLLNANPYFNAYNPDNGEELWSLDYMNGEVAPSPAYYGHIAFAANQYATLVAADILTGDFLWEYYDDLPNVSSPLATENYLILPTAYGVVTCLDALTGEVLWFEEWEEGFYSSPISAGGNVYMADLSGVVHIFKPGSSYEEVALISMGEPVLSTPAFSEGRIYIRTESRLYGIGE